ncbi:putative aldo/keto reductase [Aspergillus steynii IBT 23096]|uniref:Putative aldo/keto reductase n=1 Tax=Aspergillus steynii IBT 23096 TaxID=1392250 RepID=A0A2I2GGY4_9EURO|nr:putative aldo/keto reductase [Aspergillus steynii IBT 23096]PLB52146.1 putative aldo/keto reductase [Aspergillus steynii IBT 23096]
MSLPTRTLGKNGPPVTSVGFGLMSIGGIYGPKGTDEERFALLDHAHEIGEHFWDTADLYFDSEEVVGKWIRKNPAKAKDIFLATKFAIGMGPDGSLTLDSSPEYVKIACQRSLDKLGVETINLYYCHRVDGKTPIEKTIEAMVELKNEGKIRYLGLSEVTAQTLRRAHAVHPISALQVEYSAFAVDIEDPKIDLLRTCRELGVAVVAYSPIGRGLLTGRYKSHEDLAHDPLLAVLPRYSKENFPRILELMEIFKSIATRKGCTPVQLAMAWLMARGDDIIPIPGTRSIKYLDENVGTAHVEVTDEEQVRINDAVQKSMLQGSRYPQGMPANFELGETPSL